MNTQRKSLDELWESEVKTKTDATEYFKKYYPALTDHMIEGIVNYMEQCLKEKSIPNSIQRKQENLRWNPMKEIEEQKNIGLLNLTRQRLDSLFDEETLKDLDKNKK